MKSQKIKFSLKALLFLFLSFSTLSLAQDEEDLESWNAVELEIKASKKLAFAVSEHLRYRNDISSLKNYFTQIKINYSLFKKLSLSGGVRYITKNDDVGNIQGNKYYFRYQFDALFDQKIIDNWRLSLRLRYQNKNQLGLSEDEGDIAIEYSRFRAGLETRIKPLKLNLKLFAELFNEHDGVDENNGFNRQRFTLKLNRKFKDIGTFGIFYAMQDDTSRALKNSKSIVGFKYTYKINLTK